MPNELESLTADAKKLYLNRLHRAAIHLHFDRPSLIKKLSSVITAKDIEKIPPPKELLEQVFIDNPKKPRAGNSPAHIKVPGS